MPPKTDPEDEKCLVRSCKRHPEKGNWSEPATIAFGELYQERFSYLTNDKNNNNNVRRQQYDEIG